MKKIFITLFAATGIIGLQTNVNAQCTVIATANPLSVCQGESSALSATATIGGTFYAFNFNNNTLPPGWSFTGAASFGTTPACAAPSLDNTSFYWSSTAASTPILMTDDLDVTSGGTINYDFRFAPNSGSGSCETADQYNEGVSLEYSTDAGASWSVIVYHCSVATGGPWAFVGGYAQTLLTIPGATTPGNANGSCGIYNNWANYVIPIPPAALTTATRFRWRQPNSSGSCCDNWGLDNINIAAQPSLEYDWSNGLSGTNANSQTITNLLADTCVVVTVTDITSGAVCYDTVCIDVTASPNATLTFADPFCAGETVVLDGSNSDANLTQFDWDLNNDGTFELSSGAVPSHTENSQFASPGTYPISMNASTAGGCEITVNAIVNVFPNPAIDISFQDSSVCINSDANLNALVTLNLGSGQSSVITMIEWDYENDGTTDSTNINNITYNFPSLGTLPVTVTATTDLGCVNSETLNLTIVDIPHGTIVAPTICGNEAQEFSFNNTAGGPITTYDWDFGDASTGTDVSAASNPTYLYPAFGTYTATLIATNADNCVSTFQQQFSVGELPAGAIVNVGNCEYALEIFEFDQTSSNQIATYEWTFPNGSLPSSGNVSPAIAFSPAGIVTIELILTGQNGCIDTLETPFEVLAAPIAGFDVYPVCISRFTIDAMTTPDDNTVLLNWNLGDGNMVSNTDTTTLNHLYGGPGTYNVTLIASNPTTMCSDTISQQITVNDEQLMKVPNVVVPSSLVGNNTVDLDLMNPGINNCIDYTYTIFNRWGNTVFSMRNDPTNPDQSCGNCFKGKTDKGVDLTPGVYFYTLKGDYKVDKSGSITITD
ncbi:MAG: PKD domain-containing protein [Bacteroidota bacterium]